MIFVRHRAARVLLTHVRMQCTAITVAILACTGTALADPVIASATDATQCSARERAHNAATLRRTLGNVISTRVANASGQVDATIVSLTVEPNATVVTASAQVRLAISDDNGRIVSVVTGNARVETDARNYRPHHASSLRDDAVSAAVSATSTKLAQAFSSPSRVTVFRTLGDIVAFARPFKH